MEKYDSFTVPMPGFHLELSRLSKENDLGARDAAPQQSYASTVHLFVASANKPEKFLDCPRRRLRGAAGRKTLFGSSEPYPEPDVTLADGCCFSDK